MVVWEERGGVNEHRAYHVRRCWRGVDGDVGGAWWSDCHVFSGIRR